MKHAAPRQGLSSWQRLVRPSVPPHTMLPFLYQTRTIQQEPAKTSYRRQVNNGLRSSRRTAEHVDEDDIPFDDQLETTHRRQRTSTITDVEREAFTRLFNMAISSPANTSQPNTVPERSAEKAIRQTSGKGEDLGSILNAAAARARASPQRGTQGEDFVLRFPSALRSMAAQTQERIQQKQAISQLRGKAGKAKEKEDPVQKLQEAKAQKVESMLRAARTDVELWNVLESEVFSAIRKLDLDGTAQTTAEDKSKKPKKKRPKKDDASKTASTVGQKSELLSEKEKEGIPDLAIIGPNYPSLLLLAMRQLRHEFSSSSLTFALLPAVKSLGRGSYVLGASTLLYNELISATWQAHADFQAVDELLQEMDNGGIDIDASTLDLLDSIFKEKKHAEKGRLGPNVGAIWQMEMMQRGLNRIERWQHVIRERIEAEALRLANEREAEIDDEDFSDGVVPL